MNTETRDKTAINPDYRAEEDRQVLLEAGQALRDLSHFAKNILQMVGGAAEVMDLALQRKDMDRLRQSSVLLNANVDRLKRLTIDLCEYSKVRPLNRTTCRLNDLVQDAVRSLPPGMDPLLASLCLNLSDALPETKLDVSQITQAIRHMLIHLLDTPDNPENRVAVETCHLAANRELHVCFSAPVTLPTPVQALFEPAEYKNSRFRTGLNLPLAVRFISRHDGRIELEPLPGGTVNLIVCLPLS